MTGPSAETPTPPIRADRRGGGTSATRLDARMVSHKNHTCQVPCGCGSVGRRSCAIRLDTLGRRQVKALQGAKASATRGVLSGYRALDGLRAGQTTSAVAPLNAAPDAKPHTMGPESHRRGGGTVHPARTGSGGTYAPLPNPSSHQPRMNLIPGCPVTG